MDVPTVTKTEEIATEPTGKRARDELPIAAPLETPLGKLRIKSAQRGTRDRPRYIEFEFDRNEAQRTLATVRFPDTELARFQISEQDRKSPGGAAYKERKFKAPWARDEIGTRTDYGEFALGVVENFVEKCTIDGHTPVDLVAARYPAYTAALPAWDAVTVGMSRFMRATKKAMSVWSKGTYGSSEAVMKEQPPLEPAQPVTSSETPGEDGVFLVPIFETQAGRFVQRKATLKRLEAVVTGVEYSDLDGGSEGVKTPSVWLTPIVTVVHFELM